MQGRGCNHCNHTGYRGRMGIFEMMKMTSQIREMTFKREPTQEIREVARKQGMRTLLEDGIIKALKGMTTLEEVLSICHHEALAESPADRSRQRRRTPVDGAMPGRDRASSPGRLRRARRRGRHGGPADARDGPDRRVAAIDA